MPTPTDKPSRPNRGRAAGPGNRRALIAAAREVYAEEGLSAPFSAVARRAGVGQGSLYRHFPDRVALAVAVFEENIEDLEAYTSPEDRTIGDLLDRVADQATVSTAFIELVTAHLDEPPVAGWGARFREVVERLVARERTAGHLGDHVDADDVQLAAGMLAAAVSGAEPSQRAEVADRSRRLLRAAFAPR